MSRTTPDPVFAAAARAELERRVRLGRPTATASFQATPARRPWVREFAAVVGVLVLVGGVAAGMNALRPSADPGQGPVGSITHAATPGLTVNPSATLAPSPTDLPTSPAPTTAPPTVAPTGEPTGAPTESAPTATTPPRSTETTPPPAKSGTLVGPTGAVQRTDDQIRAYSRAQGNDDIWAEQGVLISRCMAAQGFVYDPEYRGIDRAGLTETEFTLYSAALYGTTRHTPYDWRLAGCDGAAVHATGQENNR